MDNTVQVYKTGLSAYTSGRLFRWRAVGLGEFGSVFVTNLGLRLLLRYREALLF